MKRAKWKRAERIGHVVHRAEVGGGSAQGDGAGVGIDGDGVAGFLVIVSLVSLASKQGDVYFFYHLNPVQHFA